MKTRKAFTGWREQCEVLAAQDRVLAQQTEMLSLLKEHIAAGEGR